MRTLNRNPAIHSKSRAQKEAEEQRMFDLKQQKKREKQKALGNVMISKGFL